MKIYYASEFISKQKVKLATQTILIPLFYYFLFDSSKEFFFIFLGIYLISVTIKSFHIYKYHQHLPIAEYDENGIVVLFGYKLSIPATTIKAVESSQHKLTFILQDGRKAGTQLRDMMPHEDFERLVDFFASRFPHERVA